MVGVSGAALAAATAAVAAAAVVAATAAVAAAAAVAGAADVAAAATCRALTVLRAACHLPTCISRTKSTNGGAIFDERLHQTCTCCCRLVPQATKHQAAAAAHSQLGIAAQKNHMHV